MLVLTSLSCLNLSDPYSGSLDFLKLSLNKPLRVWKHTPWQLFSSSLVMHPSIFSLEHCPLMASFLLNIITSLWYITSIIFLGSTQYQSFPVFPLLTRSILLTLIWIKPFLLLYFRCWEMLDKIRVAGTATTLKVSTVTCHLNTALNQLLFYFSRLLFPNIDHPLQNTHSLLLPLFSGDTFFSIQGKNVLVKTGVPLVELYLHPYQFTCVYSTT